MRFILGYIPHILPLETSRLRLQRSAGLAMADGTPGGCQRTDQQQQLVWGDELLLMPLGGLTYYLCGHILTYDLMAPRGKERCGWVKSVVKSIKKNMANDCSIHFRGSCYSYYIYNIVVIFRWWWWSRNCLLGRSGVVPLAAALDAGLVSTKEVESVDLGLKWGEWWWDVVRLCSRYMQQI